MIEVINYIPCKPDKGYVIGFVDVRIVKMKLILRRIQHLQKADNKWFQFPKFKESDDRFLPFIEFDSDALKREFFTKLSDAVKEFTEKKENTISTFEQEELPF